MPRVRTTLSSRDTVDNLVVRLGYGRYDYKITPGLYCVGNPTSESPVIVTANYKLTFDMVRKELGNMNAWLLIVDTRGINVWCAAGKGLFSTEEIAFSVIHSRLAEIVSHKELILPQLGATGVAAHKIQKACGFTAIYGPVWAQDLPAFIQAGNTATQEMRTVTFTLKQRAELIPVELFTLGKTLTVIVALALLLSGIGSDIYSLSAAWTRGLAFICATLLGLIAGGAMVPLLLPKLPWHFFAPKGALVGSGFGLPGGTFLFFNSRPLGVHGLLDLDHRSSVLHGDELYRFHAVHFTDRSRKEMRRFIPIQGIAASVSIIIWLAAPFMG